MPWNCERRNRHDLPSHLDAAPYIPALRCHGNDRQSAYPRPRLRGSVYFSFVHIYRLRRQLADALDTRVTEARGAGRKKSHHRATETQRKPKIGYCVGRAPRLPGVRPQRLGRARRETSRKRSNSRILWIHHNAPLPEHRLNAQGLWAGWHPASADFHPQLLARVGRPIANRPSNALPLHSAATPQAVTEQLSAVSSWIRLTIVVWASSPGGPYKIAAARKASGVQQYLSSAVVLHRGGQWTSVPSPISVLSNFFIFLRVSVPLW